MPYQGETKDGEFRVDVVDYGTIQGSNPPHWASNALRFDTRENATSYAADLSYRWLALAAYRVVPADIPQGQVYDPDQADKVFHSS